MLLLYGYELPGWALSRVSNAEGIDYADETAVMDFLDRHGVPSGLNGVHVEKHRIGQVERFFLGNDRSFRYKSSWGVHPIEQPEHSKDARSNLVKAMEALGAHEPDDPQWLMVVDFS